MAKKSNDIYAGKISLEDRIILLLVGIFCFPVGVVLYFYFKDKGKDYHVKFARIGFYTGMVFALVILLFAFFCSLSYLLSL